MAPISWLWTKIIDWLVYETPVVGPPLCNFDTLAHEIRPADVILVEGRSRVSEVIKTITQSPWSHSMLYVGRLHDIESHALREKIRNSFGDDPHTQWVVEAIIGQGTILSPLDKYRSDHLRICRPRDLSHIDAQKVIAYALGKLGMDYDVRQILDLARFMFPYHILPRRWRSSLFLHNAGGPTRTVCSTMMAEAFMSVSFPIRPVVHHDENGELRFYKRNARLYAPRDFDYSPYFEIIKYPFWGSRGEAPYKDLDWGDKEKQFIDEHDLKAQIAAKLTTGSS